MGSSTIRTILKECERRKHDAIGRPVLLANKEEWLLREVSFNHTLQKVTNPYIDAYIDRVYRDLSEANSVNLCDIWGITRILLLSNYDLLDAEISDLLEVRSDEAIEHFIHVILSHLSLFSDSVPSFSDWIRASFLVCNIPEQPLDGRTISHVMQILVSTDRIPSFDEFQGKRTKQETNSIESFIC